MLWAGSQFRAKMKQHWTVTVFLSNARRGPSLPILPNCPSYHMRCADSCSVTDPLRGVDVRIQIRWHIVFPVGSSHRFGNCVAFNDIKLCNEPERCKIVTGVLTFPNAITPRSCRTRSALFSPFDRQAIATDARSQAENDIKRFLSVLIEEGMNYLCKRLIHLHYRSGVNCDF